MLRTLCVFWIGIYAGAIWAKPVVTLSNGRQYDLKSHLGGGTFGEVYAAVDLTDNSEVAVKLFFDRGNYETEASVDLHELAKSQGAPFVVETKTSGLVTAVTERGGSKIKGVEGAVVMEKVDGTLGKLAARLHIGDSEGKPLARVTPESFRQKTETLFSLTSQMLLLWGGLASNQLIHGDIKPINMGYVGDPPRLKLLDMGPTVRGPLTAASDATVYYTEHYAAPEVFQFRHHAMPRRERVSSYADLWSLSKSLRELVCGECQTENARSLVETWKTQLPAAEENAEAIRKLDLVLAFIEAGDQILPSDRERQLREGPLGKYVRFEGYGRYYETRPRIHEAGLREPFVEKPGEEKAKRSWSDWLADCRRKFAWLVPW